MPETSADLPDRLRRELRRVYGLRDRLRANEAGQHPELSSTIADALLRGEAALMDRDAGRQASSLAKLEGFLDA